MASGILEGYQMWRVILAEQPYGQPWTRKRVFHKYFFGQAQLLANSRRTSSL